MDFTRMSVAEAGLQLRAKKISAVELTKEALKRVQAYDASIRAFLHVDAERALKQATLIQQRFDNGEPMPALAGIPMAHKDVFLTEGMETTAASNILKNYIPPYSATVAKRIADSGGVLLGKVNCDAFAHGSSTENSDFGPTRNPFSLQHVPGGSSGGSAAAVAASMVLFATGTDTGGSIRHPASFTNTVGLKPTYGRVSRYGVIAMASSTDCPGPMTKTVEDSALVLQAIAGKDPRDATTSNRQVPDYLADLAKGVQGWRIGIPKEFMSTGIDARVKELLSKAIAKYETLGAQIVEISLPRIEYSLGVYYILMTSEVSSNLARYDGIKYGHSAEGGRISPHDLLSVYEDSRKTGFGAEAKRRIMLGTYALSSGYYDAYYKKALQVRQMIRSDFEAAFAQCDIIAGPMTPTPPFKLGEKTGNPVEMYLSDIYTTSSNLSGNPAMSVPCGFVDDLPVGLQLIANHFEEDKLLRAAYAYEQATQFFKKTPDLSSKIQ